MDHSLKTIRELASETGLTRRAIRFYGDLDLLRPERRGTARLYSSECVRRAHRIVELSRFGFTLTEIRPMLSLTDREMRPLLAARKEQLDGEIRTLDHNLRHLRELIERIDREWAA